MATYYINPSHTNNGNGDGTADQVGAGGAYNSWASVSWAAGNTYLQKAGTKYVGQINLTAHGTEFSQINVSNYGGEERAIMEYTGGGYVLRSYRNWTNFSNLQIQGEGTTPPSYLKAFHIEACSNVTIDNCRMINNNVSGLGIQNAANVLVTNCISEDNGTHGFAVNNGSSNVTFKNCYAARNGALAGAFGFAVSCSVISYTTGWTGTTGVNSRSTIGEIPDPVRVLDRNAGGQGSLTKNTSTPTTPGVGEFGWAADVLYINIGRDPDTQYILVLKDDVTNTVFEDCVAIDQRNPEGDDEGHGFGCDDGVGHVTINRCITTGQAGLGLSLNSAWDITVTNCIFGNSATPAQYTRDGIRTIYGEQIYISNCIMHNFTAYGINIQWPLEVININNCITYGNDYQGIAWNNSGSTPVTNNCISYDNVLGATINTTDNNLLTVDPQLNEDYFPAPNGPCIGSGTTLLSTYDFHSRPKVGSGNHIGAKWPKLGGSSVRRKL